MFRELFETDSFDKYSKEELELLLKHHEEDLEEYKGKDDKAQASAEKDIAGIKKSMAKK